jgi:hypothetical protein
VYVGGLAAGPEPFGAEPTGGGRAPRPRSRYQAVWWAFGFAVVTTAGLALLGLGLFMVFALTYGAAAVVGPEMIAAPDDARFALGFTAAAIVNLASAPALALLAGHTPCRTWPPALQGFAAAVLEVVVAGCVLLLGVGINPVDFVGAL